MTSLRLLAVDPLDGKTRWEAPMIFQPAGTSPTPLVIDKKIVTSTMDNGTVATQIPDSAESKAKRAWQVKEAFEPLHQKSYTIPRSSLVQCAQCSSGWPIRTAATFCRTVSEIRSQVPNGVGQDSSETHSPTRT
jgi:hypothetical protein